MSNYSNRAKKAWATRRANQTANSHSNRAKKAWATIRAKQIAFNNEVFLGLSPAGKRVAIAKDVIAALQAQQVYARSGCWVSIDAGLEELKIGAELQPVFKQERCEACALGACFVSAVKLGNNCKLTASAKDDGFEFAGPDSDWGRDSTGMWTVLKRYFTERQLALIEYTFEAGDGYYKDSDVADPDTAFDFHYKYDNDGDRMLAIMQNIVANNGTFRP